MNKLKITLNEDGSVLHFAPDFKIMRGSYRNILINIEVPRSLLTEIAVDDNGDNVNGNNVRIGGIIHTALGQNIHTKSYELKWVKDYSLNGIEYSLYQRKMPKEFTMWDTYNTLEVAKSGKLDMIINVVNWVKKYDFAKVEEIASSSYVQLNIYPGSFLEGTEEIENPTDFDLLQSQVQEINKNVEQFKVDQKLLLEVKETADSAKQYADNALDRVVAGIGTIVTKDGKKQDVFNADEKANEKDLSTIAKSGEYKDLKNIPTDIANHQWVLEKIAELINSAPETLNTLGELANAVQDNDELIDILNSTIANKVSNDAFNVVVNTKVDTDQGNINANKTMVTDDDGNIIPLALHLKSEDRYTIDFAESERQKSKNLFDYKAITDYHYGVTNNGDGSFAINTQFYYPLSNVKLSLKKGVSYTYSLNIDSYSDTGSSYITAEIVLQAPEDSQTIYKAVTGTGRLSMTFVPNYDVESIDVRFIRKNNNTSTLTATVSNIQLEEGTVATDYQPYAGGQIARFGDIVGLKGTVLWENPDTSINVPGTKFESQTITLNSNDYDEFEMIYYMSSSNSRTLSVKYLKGEYGVAMCGTTTHSSGAVTYVRNCNVTDNYSKVFFENAWEAKGATAEVSQNTCCIPLKIIGYKRS